jgi:hypothetical protein
VTCWQISAQLLFEAGASHKTLACCRAATFSAASRSQLFGTALLPSGPVIGRWWQRPCQRQGHDLAFVVGHEVQLEAIEPSRGGFAARGQAVEDLMGVQRTIRGTNSRGSRLMKAVITGCGAGIRWILSNTKELK